jgi:hypothetical protein
VVSYRLGEMRRWFSSQVHICLVGVLVLSLGIFSAVDLVSSLIRGTGEFGFGFLLIFIGLGLLRGSSLQRSLFVGLLALGLIGVVVILSISMGDGPFFPGGIGLGGIGILAVILGIYLYGFFVLWDARNDPWFAEKFSGKAPAFVIPLTVALTLFYSLGIEWQSYERRLAFSKVYRYDLGFRVTDGKTGKIINKVVGGRTGGELGELDVPSWMSVSGFGFPDDGEVSMRINGYATGTLTVSLAVEGYQTKFIDVTRFTKSPVEVALEPVSQK